MGQPLERVVSRLIGPRRKQREILLYDAIEGEKEFIKKGTGCLTVLGAITLFMFFNKMNEIEELKILVSGIPAGLLTFVWIKHVLPTLIAGKEREIEERYRNNNHINLD